MTGYGYFNEKWSKVAYRLVLGKIDLIETVIVCTALWNQNPRTIQSTTGVGSRHAELGLFYF